MIPTDINTCFLGVMILLLFFISLSCKKTLPENTADQIAAQAAAHYQESILNSPYAVSAAYMEKAKCEGKYCMYTEGHGYLISAGYDYIIPTGNFVLLAKQIKKSDRTPPWLETLENWYRENPRVTHQSDVRPGISTLLSSFRWFELNGPLNKPSLYTFDIIDTLNTRQSTSSEILITFSSEVHDYSGILSIDSNTLTVQKVELDQSRFYSLNFEQWLIAEATIIYHPKNGGLFPGLVAFSFAKENLEYRIELQTSPPVKTLDGMDKSKFIALSWNIQNPFVNYEKDSPPSVHTFSTVDFETLRHDLESSKSLEEQFDSNSGAPFYTAIRDGRESFVTGGEKTYEIVHNFLEEIESLFGR